MYISGDIGSAVFELTWKADVHSFNQVGIYYFDEKLRAYSAERKEFNSHEAVKRIREWLKNIKNAGVEYDHDDMRELFEGARTSTLEATFHLFRKLRAQKSSDVSCINSPRDVVESLSSIANEEQATHKATTAEGASVSRTNGTTSTADGAAIGRWNERRGYDLASGSGCSAGQR